MINSNVTSNYFFFQLKMVVCYGTFFSKLDFTQFRKYRSLCSRQVKPIGVEHLLFFRIRNELQFVKARKVIPLEFPPFAKLTQVKLSCRNAIGYGSYMTNVLQ